MENREFRKVIKEKLSKELPGVELSNDRFIEENGGTYFQFEDYVWKNVEEWAFVPEDYDEDIVEEEKDRMYSEYDEVLGNSDLFNLDKSEDGDAYWITVKVKVPENKEKSERISEKIVEALKDR